MAIKIRLFILSFCCLWILMSCNTQRHCTDCGTVLVAIKQYDSATGQYDKQGIMPDFNIWYKDSVIIEEIKAVNIETNTSGVTTMATPVDHYIFIDLRTKMFFVYRNFSDTAKIMDKYTQPDSVEIRGTGGWRFYARNDLPKTEPLIYLTDTLIAGVIFKRIRIINSNDENNPVIIGYLHCDKKNSIFKFDKALSEKMGCPMVRFDYLPSPKNPVPTSAKIEFVSDSLTKEELQVFEAWEKNAKKYPVKK